MAYTPQSFSQRLNYPALKVSVFSYKKLIIATRSFLAKIAGTGLTILPDPTSDIQPALDLLLNAVQPLNLKRNRPSKQQITDAKSAYLQLANLMIAARASIIAQGINSHETFDIVNSTFAKSGLGLSKAKTLSITRRRETPSPMPNNTGFKQGKSSRCMQIVRNLKQTNNAQFAGVTHISWKRPIGLPKGARATSYRIDYSLDGVIGPRTWTYLTSTTKTNYLVNVDSLSDKAASSVTIRITPVNSSGAGISAFIRVFFFAV